MNAKTLLAPALAAPLAALAPGCTSNQQAGAAQGAMRGSVAGAAAGAVSALIFGGDVGKSAARGAVWAGTAGAVGGAMAGSDADRREAQQAQAAAQEELRKLREQIGEDAFDGLGALADCKHEVALAYADTAARSDIAAYAQAGLWLRALTLIETGREQEAAALYPQLVEEDGRAMTTEQAHARALEVLEVVRDYREKDGRPSTCP